MPRFMVIEHFRAKRPDEVYDRFQHSGRLLPEGLVYVDSWLSGKGDKCFQLMEANDEGLLEAWIKQWDDLVDFEVVKLGQKPYE